MTQGSYLCRQTVGETEPLCDTAIDAVQWGGTAFHSASMWVRIHNHTRHVWEPRDQSGQSGPLQGESTLNTAWDIMGVNTYQMNPDALWDTAEQSVWNNRPVLFCLGSLSNVSSEITVSETFGKTWKGRGQQVRRVKLTSWSERAFFVL